MNLKTKYYTYIQNPITPQNMMKHISASIETRLSNLSSTEIIFKKSTTHYKDNLRQSRYNKKLTYKPTDTNHQKHGKHKIKIIWFKPVTPIFTKELHLLKAYLIETKSK